MDEETKDIIRNNTKADYRAVKAKRLEKFYSLENDQVQYLKFFRNTYF